MQYHTRLRKDHFKMVTPIIGTTSATVAISNYEWVPAFIFRDKPHTGEILSPLTNILLKEDIWNQKRVLSE